MAVMPPIILKYLVVIVFLAQATESRAATTQKLAFGQKWLRILHYEKQGDGYESRVDNPKFFVSTLGKSDPLEELNVSIEESKHAKPNNDSFKCKFPLRYHFLKHNKLIGTDRIKCEDQEFFIKEMGGDQFSLVFVGQYADHPASIMGHIFLSIENHKKKIEGGPISYLFNTLNYSAQIPEDTGVVSYITKGIFGGFPGKYNLYEFGDMIEKYNNMESRDVFTYKLKLTNQQRKELLWHIWEVANHAQQDYFFFDENCAFNILALLEVIKDDENLLSELPAYTSPIEITKIVSAKGLVESVAFKPSLYVRLISKLRAMDSVELDQFHDLMNSPEDVRSVKSILVLEALVDYVDLQKHEENGVTSSEFKVLKDQVLIQRSTLGIEPPKVKIIGRESPHLSHGDSRIATTLIKRNEDVELNFKFRPFVHDILSRNQGYDANSSINMLETTIKIDTQYGPQVEKLQLFDLAKLKGSRYLYSPAWRVQLGGMNQKDSCVLCLMPYYDIDLGLSVSAIANKIDVFILGNTFSSYREVGSDESIVSNLYWTGKIGASGNWTPELRTLLFGSVGRNFENRSFLKTTAAVAFDISIDIDIRLQHENKKIGSHGYWESYSTEIGYSF